MMPTIRIDQDVFEGLKKIAEPFVDNPNTVIRRLLQQCGALPAAAQPGGTGGNTSATGKSPRLQLTPQHVYEDYLLHVLAEQFNGRAEKHEVTAAVVERMRTDGLIRLAEELRVSSGETRAENMVAWARNALKQRGLISGNSPRGTWELTAKGLAEAKRTSPARANNADAT